MSKKSKLGWFLRAGASLVAIGAASPAMAQDQPEVSDEIVVTATGRAAAIQDVPLAVTAIGAETLQNTGVQDLRDITQVAPSFSMGSGQSNSSGTTARIRGIGTGSDNPGFEAAVGIFIDGVYRARAGAALADLPDLERVEVLRGPQGTLFGRNTSAGAISVITQAPDFDFGGYIESSFGFDDLEETGMRAGVNVPVGDTIALRFDGSIRARDGYITDTVSGEDINDRNRFSLRGQALIDLNSDASLRIIVDRAETDEVCCGISPILYGSSQAVLSGIATALGPFGVVNPNVSLNFEDRQMTVTPAYGGLPALGPGLPAQPATAARSYGEQTEDSGVSAQLDWDFGGINFTSITSARDWSATRDQDIDFSSVDIAYRDGLEIGFETFTQEFRFQGENGRLNWLVGAFFANEDLATTDTIRIGAHANLYANLITQANTVSLATPNGCQIYDSTAADSDGVTDPIPSFFMCATGNAALANVYLTGNTAGQGQSADEWGIETQSLALFTHNEFALSDDLMLTVGLRYSHETKDLTANLNSTSTSCAALQGVEVFTDGLVPGPGGVVAALVASPAASIMNLACNPAINPIANGSWEGDSEENEWSGTASLAYDLSDDVMVYGGFSRGYKAGGFNVDRSGFSMTPATVDPTLLSVDDLAFDPEFTDAFEIGVKSTVLGGTTTVNLTGFYQQIHDYQLNAFNGFNFITRNVSEAISQGAELEIASQPIDGLTLTGGVVYTDAYFDTTVDFNAPGVADPFQRNVVIEGTPFAFAPEWTVTGGIAYEMPLGGDMRALFYLDGRWNDGYRTQTLSREPNGATDNDEYAIFNGRIGIGPESENWSLEFWGRNLTDETYYVGAFVPPLQDSSSNPTFANYVAYPNEPATYGVTVRLRH